MKKILFFLITWLFFQIAVSQEYQYVPFPDSNAVWSEMYWKPLDERPPSWEYNKFALFDEDTIINGIVYHKLFHTHASEITRKNSECIGGIREDSLKKVWLVYFKWLYRYPPILNELGELKLYDFNVSVNDTIFDINGLLWKDYLVVKDVDTIQIYNSKRRLISFYNYHWVSWIEGIGNIRGLMFYTGDLPTNAMDNDLICMHHNDTLLYYYSGKYGDYDDCVPQFVKNGVALLPNTEVNIYPNPATGSTVSFEGLDFETLELFDLDGNLIREEQISGMGCYLLDVSTLPPGVYTYRLKTKGLVPTGGRLIIQ